MARSLAAASLSIAGMRRENLNDPNDPRVGSGRDGSSGGSLSHVTSSGTGSASLSSLGSTFLPVGVYSIICLIIFFVLRRKFTRAYAAKSLPGIRPPEHVSPSLPTGWFNWIKPFFKIPDAFVLNHCSLDAFLFLRFVKILAVICGAGCGFSWFILLPLHGTGGNGLAELNMLTIGNVEQSVRFYAHVVVAYCFFGFILFMISRECIYYINLRQAYLVSPTLAHRLSSRTVVFGCVPSRFLNERRLRRLFGESVKNIWIPKNTTLLRNLVKERSEAAERLEKAEVEVIKKANAARRKQLGFDPPPTLKSRLGLRSPQRAQGDLEKRDAEDKVEQKPEVIVEQGGSHRSSTSSSHALPTAPRRSDSSRPSDRTRVAGEEEDAGADADTNAEYTHPYGLHSTLPDVRGSVAALWIPQEARPTHRPLANLGQSVDTIRWTRMRIKELNVQIAKLRKRHRAGDGALLSAAFIEFDTQASAQLAHQSVAHHQPLHMSPRFIGVKPQDIVWSSLRIKWWERIIRRFLMMGLISVAIIFWAIPSAFVGAMSNVATLTEKLRFLGWINSLPGPILGVIQGLVPALALSFLMAIVPWMLRGCARVAGVSSLPMIELFVQHAYFAFQVVQVFLVTTLTSAASAAFEKILQNPLSAKDLLSENLPKASNFYLSYITVQCLAGGGWNMAHLLDVCRCIALNGVDQPSKRFHLWRKMRRIHWGSIFPVFTNLGVIAICYTCIAPLILAFAGLGMCITYVVYKYNIIYTWDTDIDSLGLHYPRALMHLMVGLYLAEICLIGLFALQLAIPQMVLMVLFLVFNVLIHISLSDSLSPLLRNLPRTLTLEDTDLAAEDDHDIEADHAGDAQDPPSAMAAAGAAADYYNMEGGLGGGDDIDDPAADDDDDENGLHHSSDPPDLTRGLDGAGTISFHIRTWLRARAERQLHAETSRLTRILNTAARWAHIDIPTSSSSSTQQPNMVTRWLHPHLFQDFRTLASQLLIPYLPSDEIPPSTNTTIITTEHDAADYARLRGYHPPEMWKPAPKMWIPRDDARVSRQEVAHSKGVLKTFDRGATLDERGKVVLDLEGSPLHEPVVVY